MYIKKSLVCGIQYIQEVTHGPLSLWINVEHSHIHSHLNDLLRLCTYLCNCRYAYKTKNHMSYIIQKYSHSHTLLGHQANHDSEHRPQSVLCFGQGRNQHPGTNTNTGYTGPGVLGVGWFVYKVTV